MKNLKKILVAIPLVLVMVLSVVPVFADEVLDDYSEFVATSGDQMYNLRIAYNDPCISPYQEGVRSYPVWIAVETNRTDANHQLIPGANPFRILNGSYPVGHVNASAFAASPMEIAKEFLANERPDLEIPSYQINNVLWVDYTVMVPEHYVNPNFQAQHNYKYVSTESVTYVPSIKDSNKVEFNEIRHAHTAEEFKAAGITFADLPEKVTKDTTVTAYYNGSVTTAEVIVTGGTTGDDGTITGGTTTYQLVKPFEVTVPAGTMTVVDSKVTADFVVKGQLRDANGDPIVDINGNPVTAKVKDNGDTVAEKLVPATMKGLLIIADDKYTPVTVHHHYITAEGEVVQTTEEQINKGAELTVATVNPAWYREIAPFKVDTTRTEVNTTTKNQTLTMGQTFVEGYVVDVYYTAAEEVDQQAIDAAFTGTQAGVQNANNAATLPATGAASNAFALVASAVVAALGFLLKK